jgi:hypothetical protein
MSDADRESGCDDHTFGTAGGTDLQAFQCLQRFRYEFLLVHFACRLVCMKIPTRRRIG